MKHSNIALFVAHIGCPNTCTFCNQHIISGKQETATASDVKIAVETALGHGCRDGQLAFFGGSFTAIDRGYMLELLDAAEPYIKNGSITGIRISTRPDCIDGEVLTLLKEKGVTAIEIGAQSMVDEVLIANKRGHSARDVENASSMIKKFGFELGLQMMTGLYKDTNEGAIYTAQELIRLKPNTIRIYPTIVLAGTELHKLLKDGFYTPQTLDEAVDLCSELLLMFEAANIRVIRLGLHSGGNVEEGYVAGAYHPAFRELCENEIYYKKVSAFLATMPEGKYKIFVLPKEISKMTGQKRKNIIKLKDIGFDCSVHPLDATDKQLNKYDFYVAKEEIK